MTHHWAFSWRVKSTKQEDKQGDHAQMCTTLRWNPERKPSCEQRPRHLWECEEKQRAPSICIDRPDSRPGKDKVDQAKAP
jgi:hypothetical protein